MKTHAIPFDRPLRSVTLIRSPTGPQPEKKTIPDRVPAMADQVPASSPPAPEKLGKTDPRQPATSLDPNAEVETLLQKIGQGVAAIQPIQDTLLNEFQTLAIQLAVEIAQVVVQYEVSHHTQRIQTLVETFVNQHRPRSPVMVRVNPIDLDRLNNLDSSLFGESIQLIQDPAMARGDCRIESSTHTAAANLNRQLNDIREQLMEALDHARIEQTDFNTADSTY